jgi:hypothetical protein
MRDLLPRFLYRRPDEWSAGESLVRWTRGGPNWTVGLSFEGSLLLGASGSGKSSGPIGIQTMAMMEAGYGLLALTTKGTHPSDTEVLLKMAKMTGRENSVVLVGAEDPLGFNILRAEMSGSHNQGGQTDMASNVAALFVAATELAMPTRNAASGEHIWKQAVESILRHAVTVVFAATADLSLDDLVGVAKSAPQSPSQAKDALWHRESLCFQMLERAKLRSPDDRNLRLAENYFLSEFPGFPPETRNSVLFTLGAGCADVFQRDPLYSIFFSRTDYTPEVVLDGAILILNLPVLENREVGRIAAGLLRICTQRALEQRKITSGQRPVGILWDESQKTLLRSDVGFQETARATRCATLAATQHLPALKDAVGNDLAMSFIGNMRTKLFCQSNDPETGEYMKKLCGQREVKRPTYSKGSDGRTNTSETSLMQDALPLEATHNLKTGGAANRFRVTAYLVVGSKRLLGGKPFRRVLIHQRKFWGWLLSGRARIVARRRPAPDFRYLRRGGT